MENKLERLKQLWKERAYLRSAASVLSWDQLTHMPKGGGDARGHQLALLERLAQEKMVNPEIGRLLDELEPYVESLPYDHDNAAFVRAARREHELYGKLPPDFIGKLTQHQSATYEVWASARPGNDWKKVEPYVERALDLSREMAGYYPGYDHIADPLIAQADYGMKASDIRQVFGELRARLVPLLKKIQEQPQVDDSCLKGHFPKPLQLKFSEDVVRDIGYDFERGRMDLSAHPFTTMFSIGDVRITVRVKEDDLGDCLFSAIHEAGHAMHVQGCNPAYDATPLSGFVSAGLAESQSRTWENLVGRSRDFWEYYFPRLKAVFPNQLEGVPLETFYKAINKVTPSLIRTDADEVTYNLHPMLRFDLELALLEGSLAVKDLPDAWRDRYTSDLGITPSNDKDGVLQDVHWYGGWIGGAFQGYTLGNIISSMFLEKALETNPHIQEQMRQGRFSDLHQWLVDNIYWHGSKYTTSEILERVTGSSQLDVGPLIKYLERKYGEIYGI